MCAGPAFLNHAVRSYEQIEEVKDSGYTLCGLPMRIMSHCIELKLFDTFSNLVVS